MVGMLRLTKDLAVRVEESGSATEGYNAYTRVLEVYRTLNMPADYEMRNILIRTQSEMVGHMPCNCNSLLPPLHALIKSKYASQVPGNVLQSGFHPDVTSSSPPESPIVGGIKAILEFLEGFTDAQLEERDFNSQSLLHLAALHCKEGLGQAIIIRAKHDERFLHRLVNARDRSGQTVLTAAVSNGGSLTFITTLLESRAEYEPSTMPLAMTPLQAACSIGSLEMVGLLVSRGANIETAYPGSSPPRTIAQELGHFAMKDRLDALNCLSQSSMSSPSQASDCG